MHALQKKRNNRNYLVDAQTGQQKYFMNSLNEHMKPFSCHRGVTARRSHMSSKDRRKLLNTIFAAGNEQMSEAVGFCGEMQNSSKT
jgi:hypothetical protein